MASTTPAAAPLRLHYDSHLEAAIERVQQHLSKLHPQELSPVRSRWLAIKMLEGDDEVLRHESNHVELVEEIKGEQSALAHEHDEDTASLLASARFAFSNGLLREVRQQESDPTAGFKLTRILDDFFLNRTLGLPLHPNVSASAGCLAPPALTLGAWGLGQPVRIDSQL